jgi:hypothetical protein
MAFVGSQQACKQYPTVLEGAIPGKFDVDLTFVDHDLAQEVGREADAAVGPSLFEALHKEAGINVTKAKLPTLIYEVLWSGKVPKK